VVPFYHLVSDDFLPHISHLYDFRCVAGFEKDLEALLAVFRPVDLDGFLSTGGSRGTKPRMLLTFDDGLTECHSVIAPMLKKRGIPALFFLNNAFIDNKGLFYRYKTSLLIDTVLREPALLNKAASFLRVSGDQVVLLLRNVSYRQQVLLDGVAADLGIDFSHYLEKTPVYMSSEEIRELIAWGFEIGAHSHDHPQMEQMVKEEVIRHVLSSVMDLQQRFLVRIRCFAFPFSSQGIPREVIDTLVKQELTLFGISGPRFTGNERFIQRIDMEATGLPANDLLKAKYLLLLARKWTGREVLYY